MARNIAGWRTDPVLLRRRVVKRMDVWFKSGLDGETVAHRLWQWELRHGIKVETLSAARMLEWVDTQADAYWNSRKRREG